MKKKHKPQSSSWSRHDDYDYQSAQSVVYILPSLTMFD